MSATAEPRPRPAPRRPSRDPRLRGRDRGWYLHKEPVTWPPTDHIIDAVYELPKEEGGKLGVERYKNYVEHLSDLIEFLLRTQAAEQSAAFATSLTRQLIPALYSDCRQRDPHQALRRRRSSVARWLNDLQAVGYIHWEPVKDGIGAWWRTELWMLDANAGETWNGSVPIGTAHDGAPILNSPPGPPQAGEQQQLLEAAEPPSEGPTPAAVQQLLGGSLRQVAAAPGFSQFSTDLVPPCRDTSVLGPTAQNAVVTTDVEEVRARAREGSAQQIDDAADKAIAAPGPAESRGWGGGQVPDFARQRLQALVAEAQADPSRGVALSFAAFQLIFERRPLTLSRGAARRLRRALERCDRWSSAAGPRAGAGFQHLVSLMVARRIRLDSPPSQAQLRGFAHRRQRPRSPAYFVVPLRKHGRELRRRHDPDARRRSEAFRAGRPASYQGGGLAAQERRQRKRSPSRRKGGK